MDESVTVLRKTIFAKEIQPSSDSFDEVFKVVSVEERTKKNDEPYWTIVLKDRTGQISAKLWTAGDEPLVPGTFVKVRAEAREYRGKVELTVKQARGLQPNEHVAAEDFVPVGPFDRFATFRQVEDIVTDMNHAGLQNMCLKILSDPLLGPGLRDAPAASQLHQPYVGGLIEHVWSLMCLVMNVNAHYHAKGGALTLDRDVLITACLLHDVGKTSELEWTDEIGYSKIGKLVGHVVISMQIIERFKKAFWDGVRASENQDLRANQRVLDHLEHVVASHHGRLEWGAAKLPLSREAQLFHFLDCIDARMGQFDTLVDADVDVNGFGGFDRDSRGPFYLGER